MKHKIKEPDDPEVIEAILHRIRNRSREEWLEMIAWRQEGYVDPEDEPLVSLELQPSLPAEFNSTTIPQTAGSLHIDTSIVSQRT